MKNLKIILYFIVTLIEAGLLIGAYVIDDLALKKLGLTRWLNFNSAKWEETLPLDSLKTVIILVLALLLAAAILMYIKNRKAVKKLIAVMLVVACLMSVGSIFYILTNSFETARAYYVVCALTSAAGAIQTVKTLAGLYLCREEKR